ncbi:MAG: hypothetical protein OD815_000079 [Candidatus Alkanophagales archaeon MCA70_species_2]|nr:hypothetical protein [Candidatus Alkanophaga liquidiphilum]
MIGLGLLNTPQHYTVITFAAIGAGLKFIDDTFDENVFDKRFAGVVAPALVIMALIMSANDTAAATLLLSILLAVIFAGKVDNLVFKVNAFVFLVLFCVTASFNLLWFHLAILTAAGIIDERGNDYIDSQHDTSKFLRAFFAHRCMMKVSMLLLCAFSPLSWLYFFALLAFDAAYDSVKWLSDCKKERKGVTATES